MAVTSEGAPDGAATAILLTDVESSTALWERHPDHMQQVLARHDRIIAEAVDRHGGRLLRVRGEGDSTFSTFPCPAAAVRAACEAQQQFAEADWPAGSALRVRMAVHAGALWDRSGEPVGEAVARAARLRDRAAGGQIIVTAAVARAVGDGAASNVRFIDIGDVALRGFTRGERAFVVAATPSVHSTGEPRVLRPIELAPGLPPVLADAAMRLLVGRRDELARLRGWWSDTVRNRKTFVTIAGEPGVGKTRLVAALASQVACEDGLVLYAGCDEAGSAPFGPITAALHRYLMQCSPEEVAVRCGEGASELARLMPDIRAKLPNLPRPAETETISERARLFDAVSTLLVNLSRATPVLFVVDDVHWARVPTLLMLRHLIADERPTSIMFVATYRDSDIAATDQIVKLLGSLGSTHRTHIELRGLAADELSQLVNAAIGDGNLDGRVSTKLYQLSAGNPLFAIELADEVRHTHNADPEAARKLPASVRDSVHQRLRRMPLLVRQVVETASVTGSGIHARALVQALASAGQEPEIHDAVDHALSARFLTCHDDDIITFSHAVVQRAVYDELAPMRRRYLHTTVARAIEQVGMADGQPAELARHWSQSTDATAVARALHYFTVAGRRALERLAYEEAVTDLESARQLVTPTLTSDAAKVSAARLYLLLGRAYERCGDVTAARSAALEAATLSRACKAGDVCAEAAALYAQWTAVGVIDMTIEELCRDALAMLPAEDTATRAVVTARLAWYLAWSAGEPARAAELADAAIAAARDSGSDGALIQALNAKAAALIGSPAHEQRLRVCDELHTVAARSKKPAHLQQALFHRAQARLTAGDRAGFEADLCQYAELGDQLRWWGVQGVVAQWRAMLAILDGDFPAARRHADAAATTGGRAQDYLTNYAGQQFLIRWHVDEPTRLLEDTNSLLTRQPTLPVFHIARALLLAELGNHDAARTALDEQLPDGLSSLPPDLLWVATAAMTVETIALIHDRERADEAYSLLLPYAGATLVVAQGVACLGSTHRYLGMLATVLNNWQAAEMHFRQALTNDEPLRSRPLRVRTHTWYAAMLAARQRSADIQQAQRLLANAAQDAARLGLTQLTRTIACELASIDEATAQGS